MIFARWTIKQVEKSHSITLKGVFHLFYHLFFYYVSQFKVKNSTFDSKTVFEHIAVACCFIKINTAVQAVIL